MRQPIRLLYASALAASIALATAVTGATAANATTGGGRHGVHMKSRQRGQHPVRARQWQSRRVGLQRAEIRCRRSILLWERRR